MYISTDVMHVFFKDTLYKVNAKVKNVTLDDTLLIKDVKSLDLVPLRCHINHDDYPANFQMTLTSESGADIRQYLVQFSVHAMKSVKSLVKCKNKSSLTATEKKSSSYVTDVDKSLVSK